MVNFINWPIYLTSSCSLVRQKWNKKKKILFGSQPTANGKTVGHTMNRNLFTRKLDKYVSPEYTIVTPLTTHNKMVQCAKFNIWFFYKLTKLFFILLCLFFCHFLLSEKKTNKNCRRSKIEDEESRKKHKINARFSLWTIFRASWFILRDNVRLSRIQYLYHIRSNAYGCMLWWNLSNEWVDASSH